MTTKWLGEEIFIPSNVESYAHLLNEKDNSVPITDEERKRIDGKYVLGIMEGCFFGPGHFSVNGRFYPKECFIGEHGALESDYLKEKLDSRTFFGTLGHEDKEIDEKDIENGKHAINVYKLWIDESTGLGMGRAYILNTKSGWNLYSAMKSGSNFKMSSRAKGSFQEGAYRVNESGAKVPVVDPKTFKIYSFDVVFKPGISATSAMLKENQEKKEIEEMSMNENSFAEIISEKERKIVELELKAKSLQEKLDENTSNKSMDEKEINELIEWRAISEDSSPVEFKKELTSLIENINELKETNAQLDKEIEELSVINESYAAFGSVSDVANAFNLADLYESQDSNEDSDKVSIDKTTFNEMKKELSDAEKIYSYIQENYGSLENIEKNFNKINESENDKYVKENFGSLDSLKKELSDAEKIYSYIKENYGSLANIEKEFADAEKIYSYIKENFGSLENIEKELSDAQKIYSYIKENYGSLENIELALEEAEKKIISLQGGSKDELVLERKAFEISKELNNEMTESEVLSTLKKYNGNLNEAEKNVFSNFRSTSQSLNESFDDEKDPIGARMKSSYIKQQNNTYLSGYYS